MASASFNSNFSGSDSQQENDAVDTLSFSGRQFEWNSSLASLPWKSYNLDQAPPPMTPSPTLSLGNSMNSHPSYTSNFGTSVEEQFSTLPTTPFGSATHQAYIDPLNFPKLQISSDNSINVQSAVSQSLPVFQNEAIPYRTNVPHSEMVEGGYHQDPQLRDRNTNIVGTSRRDKGKAQAHCPPFHQQVSISNPVTVPPRQPIDRHNTAQLDFTPYRSQEEAVAASQELVMSIYQHQFRQGNRNPCPSREIVRCIATVVNVKGGGFRVSKHDHIRPVLYQVREAWINSQGKGYMDTKAKPHTRKRLPDKLKTYIKASIRKREKPSRPRRSKSITSAGLKKRKRLCDVSLKCRYCAHSTYDLDTYTRHMTENHEPPRVIKQCPYEHCRDYFDPHRFADHLKEEWDLLNGVNGKPPSARGKAIFDCLNECPFKCGLRVKGQELAAHIKTDHTPREKTEMCKVTLYTRYFSRTCIYCKLEFDDATMYWHHDAEHQRLGDDKIYEHHDPHMISSEDSSGDDEISAKSVISDVLPRRSNEDGHPFNTLTNLAPTIQTSDQAVYYYSTPDLNLSACPPLEFQQPAAGPSNDPYNVSGSFDDVHLRPDAAMNDAGRSSSMTASVNFDYESDIDQVALNVRDEPMEFEFPQF